MNPQTVPPADFSFSALILAASPLAQLILLLLLMASVYSWTVIFAKRNSLKRASTEAQDFENRFWAGGAMSELYAAVNRRDQTSTGLPGIFKAGYEEFVRQQNFGSRTTPEDALAAVTRQMRVAQVREMESLEGGLSQLATIASASPYVGLFGTVWGIMSAFIAIGQVKQASLAMVAPGIAEALIATAMGLFAAIPAMIAYNTFSRAVDRLESRYHMFAEEMCSVLDRGLRAQRQ